jgi:hypothetical protein
MTELPPTNGWEPVRLMDTVRQSLGYHPLTAFPGRCYFARLPDGTIKIGYSNTVDLMYRRMRALTREYGAEVELLADLPGGFITEALMHERFWELRIPGNGEKFEPSPELLDFIECVARLSPWSP